MQNIDIKVSNSYIKEIILKFYEYFKSIDTSENYQNGVLNAIMHFSEFFDTIEFDKIAKKKEILKFLDSKKKSKTENPEQKWNIMGNDYLWRIEYFLSMGHY